MPRFRRGVEYEGTPELIAPGMSIPKRAPRGIANQGDGNNVFPQPTIGWDSKEWAVCDAGVTHIEAAGAGITVNDLSAVNSSLQGLGYSYPGEAADDNSWTVQWSLPDNIDVTKPIYVTITVVCE
jgi:hypothetical protein